MAPKVPSHKQLATELAKTVREIYAAGERDVLTVNLVRSRTEKKLGLHEGFFKDEEWKNESKQIIKETVDKLESEPDPPSSPISVPKAEDKKQGNGRKRAGAAEDTPPKKRRQITKKAAPKKSESELSELSDSDVSEKPAKRKRLANRGAQRPKRTVTSDSEDEDEQQDDSDNSESSGSEARPKKRAEQKDAPKKAAPKQDIAKKPDVKTDIAPLGTDSPLSEPADEDSEKQVEVKKTSPVDESSESEVFDEPPKRKRKSKEASAKPSGKPAKAKPSKPKSTADTSPDEAEIKKLQGQLVKCGVRKIWAFELKRYGEDSRAKIRHLKEMLKEVGMDGRFSESKAREIKERRELLADLEDVKEMNENLDWGPGGGRTSRSRAARPKTLIVDDDDSGSDEDEDGGAGAAKDTDDGDEDDDEEQRNPRARAIAKRRADFAFLGDDEESD